MEEFRVQGLAAVGFRTCRTCMFTSSRASEVISRLRIWGARLRRMT